MQNQGHQSLQLTEEEERSIERLRIKRKVKKIMESNNDIDVKRSLVENVIEEAILKRKQNYQDNRDEALAYQKQYDQDHRDEIRERKRQNHQDHRDEKIAIYNKNHQRAIDMLGKKCIATGTNENLDFAHRDPSGKVFNIADRLHNPNFFNDPRKVEELNKCSLLCRQAHKAYDFTWVSIGYPQSEKTFPIWLDSYRKWHNNHRDRIKYREYLINNPRHGEIAS